MSLSNGPKIDILDEICTLGDSLSYKLDKAQEADTNQLSIAFARLAGRLGVESVVLLPGEAREVFTGLLEGVMDDDPSFQLQLLGILNEFNSAVSALTASSRVSMARDFAGDPFKVKIDRPDAQVVAQAPVVAADPVEPVAVPDEGKVASPVTLVPNTPTPVYSWAARLAEKGIEVGPDQVVPSSETPDAPQTPDASEREFVFPKGPYAKFHANVFRGSGDNQTRSQVDLRLMMEEDRYVLFVYEVRGEPIQGLSRGTKFTLDAKGLSETSMHAGLKASLVNYPQYFDKAKAQLDARLLEKTKKVVADRRGTFSKATYEEEKAKRRADAEENKAKYEARQAERQLEAERLAEEHRKPEFTILVEEKRRSSIRKREVTVQISLNESGQPLLTVLESEARAVQKGFSVLLAGEKLTSGFLPTPLKAALDTPGHSGRLGVAVAALREKAGSSNEAA